MFYFTPNYHLIAAHLSKGSLFKTDGVTQAFIQCFPLLHSAVEIISDLITLLHEGTGENMSASYNGLSSVLLYFSTILYHQITNAADADKVSWSETRLKQVGTVVHYHGARFETVNTKLWVLWSFSWHLSHEWDSAAWCETSSSYAWLLCHMHTTLIGLSKINKYLCQLQNFHVALLIQEDITSLLKVSPKQSRQPDEEAAKIQQLPSCWKVHHPKVVSSLWTAVPLILDRGLNHFSRTTLCSNVGSFPPARIWTAYSLSSRKDARLMPKPMFKHFWDQKIIRVFPSLLICALHGIALVLKFEGFASSLTLRT